MDVKYFRFNISLLSVRVFIEKKDAAQTIERNLRASSILLKNFEHELILVINLQILKKLHSHFDQLPTLVPGMSREIWRSRRGASWISIGS